MGGTWGKGALQKVPSREALWNSQATSLQILVLILY